jgi:serine/threonine protein kinase
MSFWDEMSEVKALKTLNGDPHIVQLIDAFIVSDRFELTISMELAKPLSTILDRYEADGNIVGVEHALTIAS